MTAGANENGPGAAATAHRAGVVASGKPTNLDIQMPEDGQSRFAVPPDNTGGKQATAGRPSLRSAIDAKCKDCIYDPGGGNGTWREQVEACASANCPLHSVRPISVKVQKRPTEARLRAPGSFEPSPGRELLPAERLYRNGPTAEQRRAA